MPADAGEAPQPISLAFGPARLHCSLADMRIAYLALIVVAAGCSSAPNRLTLEDMARPRFHPVLRTFVSPETHRKLEWLDQGGMSSDDYPNLQSPPTVLDHLRPYEITKSQLEDCILNSQLASIAERKAHYDASRATRCYVDPFCGFGGGTVFIFIPVQSSSRTNDCWDVYGLHIRLRELRFRYSTANNRTQRTP